ncbi:unnamed protein product [Euphydryas editha]|uniref:Uncharacterized protein n=1 Tax=Euphydryas editha TaxID=104508 RepID=A0AAU9VFS6_EUPED|nr:unnamed protein product [Euphydryas editha]
MFLIIVFFTGLIVNISGDENFYYDDNSILFDLLNGDYVTGVDEEDKTENFQEEEPQLLDGVWKCGNCTNIDKSKLLFVETVHLDTNYVDTGFELQIEYSVNNMSCIVIEAGAIDVRRISGACAGEDVTLSIRQKSNIEVKIYE